MLAYTLESFQNKKRASRSIAKTGFPGSDLDCAGVAQTHFGRKKSVPGSRWEPGPILGAILDAFLVTFWEPLGPPWAPLGSLWVPFGSPWGPLAPLGAPEAHLGS